MPVTTSKKASKKASKKSAKKSATKISKKSPRKPAAPRGPVGVGAKAPDFTLPDAAGRPVSLSGFAGKPVVLYFYPKDDTPGCTQEACDFRDRLPRFRKLRCAVLGVSPDSARSHAKFAAKHALPFTLLADEPGADGVPAVCAAFGVWQEKSMYGRKYMGVVRTTVVIDGAGMVAARFDQVSVEGHADEVLAAVARIR